MRKVENYTVKKLKFLSASGVCHCSLARVVFVDANEDSADVGLKNQNVFFGHFLATSQTSTQTKASDAPSRWLVSRQNKTHPRLKINVFVQQGNIVSIASSMPMNPFTPHFLLLKNYYRESRKCMRKADKDKSML